MKIIPPILVLCIIFFIVACKKTVEPGTLMKTTTGTYVPTENDANKFKKKVMVLAYPYPLKDIIVDKANPLSGLLIGNFNIQGNINAVGIARVSSVNNALSSYFTTTDGISQANIASLYQAPNGKTYFSGVFTQNSAYRYFGERSPNGTITSTIDLDNIALAINEIDSKIYLTGAFTKLNGVACAPVLMLNDGAVTGLGPLNSGTRYYESLVRFKDKLYTLNNGVNGKVAVLNIDNTWTQPVGGGFNNSLFALKVLGDKLYACGRMTGKLNPAGNLNYVCELINDQWKSVGANKLPGECYDIELRSGTLFAAGASYICYLDNADNTWKNCTPGITVNPIMKLEFIGNKLYALESFQFPQTQCLVRLE